MKDVLSMPRLPLGIYPTPFYKLEGISAKYGKNIWIKRDDLCGVALGGNKVRKLEFLLADAKAQGCDTVFTTGGAQSNHAMLTAACAARLGMKCILPLKQRGVTDHKGNLILDDIYGAEVRFIDTDSYEDIYAEMHRWGEELAKDGHKTYDIPVGGSTALGALGYVNCVREFTAQAREAGIGGMDEIIHLIAEQAQAVGQPAGGLAQTEFEVVLVDAGAEKIKVIKVVREVVSGLGLKEAKEFVEAAPKTLKEGVSKEDAQKIVEQFAAVGAKCEIK